MNAAMRRAGAMALTAALVLAGCGDDGAGSTAPARQSGYPVTVGTCGHSHTYTQAPERVIIGWPETAKTVAALGVGNSVIGYISGKFGPLPDGVPNAKKLSAEGQASAETILSAKPDLILASAEYQVDGSGGTASTADLEKAGAGAYIMSGYCKGFEGPTTVDEPYRVIRDLGRIFDVPAKAEAVIESARKRVAAARAMRGTRDAPRIAYVNVYDGKVYALNGLSYAAQIGAIGGVNVFAGLKGNFSEVSAERVLTLHPDAIVYSWGNAQESESQQRADLKKLLGNTKAVKTDKLVGIPVRLSEGTGLAVIDAIDLVAKGVYT